MTIDLLVGGYTLQEVPCNLKHRATANDWSGQMHRAQQYRGVRLAVDLRRLRRARVPKALRRKTPGEDYQPFNAFEG